MRGLMDNLLGNLGGGMAGFGKTVQPTQMPFESHLGITDGDADYDTMAEVLAIIGGLAAGSVSTLIWQKTVPAQQQIRWGFGSPALPMNQGYMWFCSLDTNIDFQVGVLRLVQANARQTNVKTVLEVDDTRLHTNVVTTLATATPIDKNEMIALPQKLGFPRVGEDSLLQLWYRCITEATAEDNVGFSIPITVIQ